MLCRDMQSVNRAPRADDRVGGWLLLLCILLLVWQPISVGVAASRSLGSITLAGGSFALFLLVKIVAAGVGIAAGLSLLGRRPTAVALAKASLVLSAAIDLFDYLQPFFPSRRAPGETPLFVIVSITYYGGWLLYLARSKRVRALTS